MKTVQLIPIGNAPVGLLKELEPPLMSQVGLAIVQGKSMLAAPTYAFNKDRNQYHSNAIMRRLVPLVEAGQGVFALCDVDLFVPDSTFVFGEADRESKVALLSLARLRGTPGSALDSEQVRRRAQIEGLHLAGHLVGLSYCEDPRCVMFLATTPQEVDRKQPSLCHVCRNEMAKLAR